MAEASRLPISNQQAAIRTLDGFSDGAIQGFFTYAYSIELLKSGGKVQNDRLSLSWEQLAAIKFLKDCPFELIQSWRSRPLQPGRLQRRICPKTQTNQDLQIMVALTSQNQGCTVLFLNTLVETIHDHPTDSPWLVAITFQKLSRTQNPAVRGS